MRVCPQCCDAFVDGRFCPADGVALVQQNPHVPGLALERELGRGLTGTVWRARRADGCVVAVKVLHREWAGHHEMHERFRREAGAAAAVDHPCVVAPLSTGTLADGRPYLVMELVDGPALDEVLALGPLPEARALAIAMDLAAALAAVHAAGVVHRDVKPGNVRIDRAGRARLLDFGVARRIDSDEPRLTNGGLTVGTPHYMAPEQCTGDAVSGRSDVYGLGVVLYRMLTGTVPFEGSAAVAVMLAHAARTPDPVRSRAPQVSIALDALVARCLRKGPAERPDAAGLALALAEIADGAGDAIDPAGATRAQVGTSADRLGRAATVPTPDLWEPASVEAPTVPAPWLPPLRVRRSDRHVTAQAPRLPRRRRGRAVALAALGVIAALALLGTTGLDEHLGFDLDDLPRPARAEAPRPAPPPPGPLPAPAVPQDYLMASDGGVALRLSAPSALSPRVDHELSLEVWDERGAPIDTTDMVVTFAGPGGAVVGLAAEPTRARGVYRVRTRFDAIGEWSISVFPPVGDAVVTFRLDVGVLRPVI